MTVPLRWIALQGLPGDCPYRPGQTRLQRYRRPTARVPAAELDRLLESGARRAGDLFYWQTCPTCAGCEALRVDAQDFTPTGSQRASVKKNRDLVVRVAEATCTPRHLELFNRHKRERGLSRSEAPTDEEGFRGFLLDSPVQTVEVRYELSGELVAFSVLDLGADAISSVYHCFDPDHARRSLGVFSAVRELALTAELGKRWYYLGLWVQDCPALAYKSAYHPHEKRRDGRWRSFPVPVPGPDPS